MVKKWAASWQNQQNGMCAQRRLRSVWASAQSYQESSLSAGTLATHWAHSEDFELTGFDMRGSNHCSPVLKFRHWESTNKTENVGRAISPQSVNPQAGNFCHHRRLMMNIILYLLLNSLNGFSLSFGNILETDRLVQSGSTCKSRRGMGV